MRIAARISALLGSAALLGLMGCTPFSTGYDGIPTVAPYGYRFPERAGDAAVRGQALWRQDGGGLITCAGDEVYMFPVSEYAQHQLQQLKYGDRLDLSRQPGFHKQLCDAQGNFSFRDLGAGDWYVVSRFVWYENYKPQGGWLVTTVDLAPGERERVIVNERNLFTPRDPRTALDDRYLPPPDYQDPRYPWPTGQGASFGNNNPPAQNPASNNPSPLGAPPPNPPPPPSPVTSLPPPAPPPVSPPSSAETAPPPPADTASTPPAETPPAEIPAAGNPPPQDTAPTSPAEAGAGEATPPEASVPTPAEPPAQAPETPPAPAAEPNPPVVSEPTEPATPPTTVELAPEKSTTETGSETPPESTPVPAPAATSAVETPPPSTEPVSSEAATLAEPTAPASPAEPVEAAEPPPPEPVAAPAEESPIEPAVAEPVTAPAETPPVAADTEPHSLGSTKTISMTAPATQP